jgi:hypothetical protein
MEKTHSPGINTHNFCGLFHQTIFLLPATFPPKTAKPTHTPTIITSHPKFWSPLVVLEILTEKQHQDAYTMLAWNLTSKERRPKSNESPLFLDPECWWFHNLKLIWIFFSKTHALTHKKSHLEQIVLRNQIDIYICVYIHNLGVDGLYERILVGDEKIAPKIYIYIYNKSLQVTGRGERW